MLGVRDKMEEKQGLVHRRGGGRIVQNMMKMLKIEKGLWSASKKIGKLSGCSGGKTVLFSKGVQCG